MNDLKKDLKNLKDKAEGDLKENIGKLTGDQELELEGKIKKKIVEAKESIAEAKDKLLEKINDKLDELDQ